MLKIGIGVLLVAFFLIFVPLTGCGGGGGDSSSGSPVLRGSLATYDFGDVTLNNFPAAKVVTFSNSGDASLLISDIELNESGGAGFTLNLDSGVNFCGSTTPTIPAGSSCAIAVGFGPTTARVYNGTLSVSSNDPDTSFMEFLFTGTGVAITVPTVKINRVEPDTCASSELSIYLSVTDQLGYPIVGLTESDFAVSETFGGPELSIDITSQSSVSAPISVVLAMDYSRSITDHPEILAAMEDGVVSFIHRLGDNDEAEIIKFDSEVEVVQEFTAGDAVGQEALITKVIEPWDMGDGTRFNDVIYRAVDDLATRSNDRSILILFSDGFNSIFAGDTPSIYTYDQAKAYAMAKGIHVFTIGIGSDLNGLILDSLATDTGGQYFDTLVADDLNTIYQQLAQILFVDQYLLTYDSVFSPGDSALLKVGVTVSGNVGEDSLDIIPCPLP